MKISNNKAKDQATNKKDHEFSEELSDGGERDEIIKKKPRQNSK